MNIFEYICIPSLAYYASNAKLGIHPMDVIHTIFIFFKMCKMFRLQKASKQKSIGSFAQMSSTTTTQTNDYG